MKRITKTNGMYIISEVRRKAPPAPVSNRPKGVLFLLLALLGIGLFNVWLSGQCIHTGYRISSALEEKRMLQMQKDVLSAEVLTLRSPSRIDVIARTQLGMVDPLMEGVIR